MRAIVRLNGSNMRLTAGNMRLIGRIRLKGRRIRLIGRIRLKGRRIRLNGTASTGIMQPTSYVPNPLL